jgi:Tol biopolymer transport system component
LLPPDHSSSILGYGIDDYAWRPNTHILAYSTLILHEGPGLGPNHDLYLVDADSLQKTTLFKAGEGGLFYFSPDGSQIALSNPESLSLVNADGTDLRKDVLTFPDVITYSEYAYHPHPNWADDSLSLGVAIPPHDPMADPLPPTALWSVPADGSPPVFLTDVPAMPFAWPNNTFAPDMKHIAYVTQVGDPAGNQRELHLALPDGTNDETYTQGESLEFISWSPNSRFFIYRINGGPDVGVYLGGIDIQPRLVIFDPDVVSDIKWFGSSRLVFPFRDGTEWLLFIQDPDTGELNRIDILPDSNPSFDVLP